MPTKVKFEPDGKLAKIWESVYDALYDFENPREVVTIPMRDENAAIGLRIQLYKWRRLAQSEIPTDAYDNITIKKEEKDGEVYLKFSANSPFEFNVVDPVTGEVLETVESV